MRNGFSRGVGVAPEAKKPEAKKPAPPTDGETRLAPDPFTAVLPALAALGAIASIATINWVAQERTPDRGRAPSARRASALRDLENCCLGLQEIFRRFQRNPQAVRRRRGSPPRR